MKFQRNKQEFDSSGVPKQSIGLEKRWMEVNRNSKQNTEMETDQNLWTYKHRAQKMHESIDMLKCTQIIGILEPCFREAFVKVYYGRLWHALLQAACQIPRNSTEIQWRSWKSNRSLKTTIGIQQKWLVIMRNPQEWLRNEWKSEEVNGNRT